MGAAPSITATSASDTIFSLMTAAGIEQHRRDLGSHCEKAIKWPATGVMTIAALHHRIHSHSLHLEWLSSCACLPDAVQGKQERADIQELTCCALFVNNRELALIGLVHQVLMVAQVLASLFSDDTQIHI